MTEIKFYSTSNERKKIIGEQHALGFSVTHDDFISSDGKQTKGNSGRLSFDVIENIPNPIYERQKILNEKLQNNTITFEELKELLRLRL